MKGIIALVSLLATLLVAALAAFYFQRLGKPFDLLDTVDLANFGTWFGGVAAPLLGLLSFIGVLYTLALQNRQIVQLEDARRADQHVRALQALFEDLQALERQAWAPDKTFAQALEHPASEPLRQHQATLARQYVEVLGLYAAQVDMYRKNVSPYWDCKAFAQRGLRLLDRIRPLAGRLDAGAHIAIAFIEGHLNGTLAEG